MTATRLDQALCRRADQVECELRAQDDAWGTSGWTRRRFLAGVGMAGVAALGTQLVTTRAAYAATPTGTERTLVTVFLRGAADGLRILVPNSSSLGLDYLQTVRGALVPPASGLIPLPGTGGWAVNSKLQPLYDALWNTGEMAFVPAMSSAGISHSHFQAQQYLERGGSDTASTGWLDRVLTSIGPGTTFRAVTRGSATPLSLAGPETTLTMGSLSGFTFPGSASSAAASQRALQTLYRGMSGTLPADVGEAIAALNTAATVRAMPAPTVIYPSGNLGDTLKDVAQMLRAEVGMEVATLDVGGWDTHTDEANDLDNALAGLATALRAFMDDLGPTRRKRVTVVIMTEFGRRVAMNASGGTDHGHGSVMWLLGGGLSASGVYGSWNPLSDATLDSGDVPGLNSPFDVLGELVQKRLSAGSLSAIFPEQSVTPTDIATTY